MSLEVLVQSFKVMIDYTVPASNDRPYGVSSHELCSNDAVAKDVANSKGKGNQKHEGQAKAKGVAEGVGFTHECEI